MVKKNLFLLILSSLIGIGVYNLCVFTLVEEFANGFWVAYAFTMVAFLTQFVTPIGYVVRKSAKTDGYLGLSVIIINAVYFVIQLITGIILMLTSASIKVTLVIETIIFACYALIIITVFAGIYSIVASKNQKYDSTLIIRRLSMNLEMLCNNEKNPDKKAILRKLYEAVRYSNPRVSNSQIENLDHEIERAVGVICVGIEAKEIGALTIEANNILELISQRNLM